MHKLLLRLNAIARRGAHWTLNHSQTLNSYLDIQHRYSRECGNPFALAFVAQMLAETPRFEMVS